MPTAERRKLRRERGDCGTCGARPPVPGYLSCPVCREQSRRYRVEGHNAKAVRKLYRTPHGWSSSRAKRHRERVRSHNEVHPDRPLLEFIIDGPALLAHVIAHGPTCSLCGCHTGFPWEYVGDSERGPEVDHILSMWAIIGEGRDDWASVSNIRLLCHDCHREEGVRLRRQDIEEKAHMDHMLGKDRT